MQELKELQDLPWTFPTINNDTFENIDYSLLGKMYEHFPNLRGWAEKDIIKNKYRIEDALEHVTGSCYCTSSMTSSGHVIVKTFDSPGKESGNFVKAECEFGRKARVKQIIQRAGFPQRHLSVLDSLDDMPGIDEINQFVNDFSGNNGNGLLLAGTVGTGKTQSAVFLGVEIVKKHLAKVKFINVFDYLSLVKGTFNNRDDSDKLEELHNNDLLILDDLGANRLSDFDYAEIGGLIDSYYRDCRPIVITTNLNKAGLTEFIGERAASRILGMCDVIALTGKDRRASKGNTAIATAKRQSHPAGKAGGGQAAQTGRQWPLT